MVIHTVGFYSLIKKNSEIYRQIEFIYIHMYMNNIYFLGDVTQTQKDKWQIFSLPSTQAWNHESYVFRFLTWSDCNCKETSKWPFRERKFFTEGGLVGHQQYEGREGKYEV